MAGIFVPIVVAIADPRASQRNALNTGAEPDFLSTPERTALEARGHHFTNAGEIGAATGIEFLAGGGVLAAAEPVRRGGELQPLAEHPLVEGLLLDPVRIAVHDQDDCQGGLAQMTDVPLEL